MTAPTECLGLGFEGAIQHIRGPGGSVVRLSISRQGKLLGVDVERREMN
jgi:C-terminal processing protease CtpA/Prc